MAHAIYGYSVPKAVTLDATNRQVLTNSGTALSGEWLEIVWAAAAQSASNLVYVEMGPGLTDNAARGADALALHPGASFRALVPVSEGLPVAVSGSSAFAVTLRMLRR